MKQYLDALRSIKETGRRKIDRTGVGTTSKFGIDMRFNMREGFPLLTTKALHLPSIVHELLWLLSGDTNIKYLNDNGVRIWNEWADAAGDLGPIYPRQWRSWPTHNVSIGQDGLLVENGSIDQISKAIYLLEKEPDSRRIIVSAWNVAELRKMALAPCHVMFQFYSEEMPIDERIKLWESENMDYIHDFDSMRDLTTFLADEKVPMRRLSLKLTQRSADFFLGVPFNVASYSLLLHMVARQVGMNPYEMIWSGGDCHIYGNHMEQVDEQLLRTPYQLPQVLLTGKTPTIFDYTADNIMFIGYRPQPTIKAKVAV